MNYILEIYINDTDVKDISEFVTEISHFNDVGTGEIVSAKIGISARFGSFLNNSYGGDRPLIDKEYQKFRLTVKDNQGTEFTRNLILDDYLPQAVTSGINTFLELYGEEYWLTKMYVPGHFYFENYLDMLKYLIQFYNDQRGPSQPLIQTDARTIKDIPNYTFGTFDFGQNTTVYEAMMEILTRLNLPVSAGGAGAYYELRFTYQDETSLKLSMFKLGDYPQENFVPVTPLTLTTGKWNGLIQTRKQLTQNLIVARGQTDKGTFPNALARYASRLEEFNEIRAYDTTLTYVKDAYVRYGGRLYQALQDVPINNLPGPAVSTFWGNVKAGQYIKTGYMGATSDKIITEYSPLTHSKKLAFEASAGNPQSASSDMGNFDGIMFHDGNLVVKDGLDDRLWAISRARALTDTALIPYKKPYNQAGAELPPETILLLDTTLGALGDPWKGSDKFNNSYENAVVKLTVDGDWIVIKSPVKDLCCAVRNEGKIYEYSHLVQNTPQANVRQRRNSDFGAIAWRDVSQTPFGNDCFHPPDIIENVDGLLNTKTKDDVEDILVPGTADLYTKNSALRVVYTHPLSPAIFATIDKVAKVVYDGVTWAADNFLGANLTSGELLTTHQIAPYKRGWWVSGSFPFPLGKFNNAQGEVGSLIGGSTGPFDFYNLNETPNGEIGWLASDADELGPTTGIGFALNLDIKFGDLRYPRGDIPMWFVIGDTEYNVWVCNFNYRLLGQTDFYKLPFSSFEVYRARTQVGFSLKNEIHRLIKPERKILEIFETRKAAWWSIYCGLEYDTDGRYEAWNWLQEAAAPFAGSLDVTYDGTIDQLHFLKTPIAISKDDNAVHNIHAESRDFPNISNLEQLEKVARSERDIGMFRPNLFTVRTNGKCDVEAGDSFYLKSPELLKTTDAGINNNLKLTARKIVYSVNSADYGAGFLREIQSYRLLSDEL